LKQVWLTSESEPFQRDWTEADVCKLAAQSEHFVVKGYVFVECGNIPAVEEAKWTLAMASNSDSQVCAVVAHVPVPDGAEAVTAFLDALRDGSGALPLALKGGRVVLLGDPMPAPDACLAPTYLEGLAELQKAGLLWEWCCLPEAIPSISKACQQFPEMLFVLDHLGHNDGGEDFDTWSVAITELSKHPNVVAKLGAGEQWMVADRGPFLDHAISAFGFERVMAESNWFVNTAMGDAYDKMFLCVKESCERLGATPEQIDMVFSGNARRVYSL